eukprot:scaffold977_cov253-Pinguiococcus_pyrenoidosus.AAC.2
MGRSARERPNNRSAIVEEVESVVGALSPAGQVLRVAAWKHEKLTRSLFTVNGKADEDGVTDADGDQARNRDGRVNRI